MKKLLLTFLFFIICSNVQAATTWYACTSGGAWSANVWTSVLADQGTCAAALGTPVAGDTAILNSSSGNITITSAAAAATIDETGYTGTLAFGTQTLTLTAASNIGGAMTSTSGIITTTGNITLLSTATGSFPTLKNTGSISLISGGFTWPGAYTFNGAGTVTLNGNWINTGLVTSNAATTLSPTTSDTFTANGGLTTTAALTGTAGLILGGGTWSGTGLLGLPLTFAGNVTLINGGAIQYNGSSITYSSGTITTTGNDLTLSFAGASPSVTLNTNGMTFNQLNFNGVLSTNGTLTVTLSSALSATSMNINNENITFSGSNNITLANLIMASGNQGNNLTNLTLSLVAGTTLNITNSMIIAGVYPNFAGSGGSMNPILIKSGTSSSTTNINYTGTMANESVFLTSFTDVTASGNTIYDYGTNVAGTTAPLTRTSNIIGINNNNIGGVMLN